MSRGVALSTIVTAIKKELGDNTETNTTWDAELKQKAAALQSDLCNTYDWPFLEDRWDLACSAGDRYKSIPTTNIRSISSTINFERPVLVERLFNTYYNPVAYGITSEHYNYQNSDDGERMDPIMRWSMDTNTGDTSNADQIEIWPIPASSQTLRFTGQRAPRTFASDSDKSELDDLLIVYFVCADILSKREMSNAPVMLGRAERRLRSLRGSYPTTINSVKLGYQRKYNRQTVKLIAVT